MIVALGYWGFESTRAPILGYLRPLVANNNMEILRPQAPAPQQAHYRHHRWVYAIYSESTRKAARRHPDQPVSLKKSRRQPNKSHTIFRTMYSNLSCSLYMQSMHLNTLWSTSPFTSLRSGLHSIDSQTHQTSGSSIGASAMGDPMTTSRLSPPPSCFLTQSSLCRSCQQTGDRGDARSRARTVGVS